MTPSPAAPGLLLSRRPAPRRLLAVIALIVLLIAAAVTPVSGDEIIENESYTYYVGGIVSSRVIDVNVDIEPGERVLSYILCRNPEFLTPSALVFAPYDRLICSNASIFYDVRPFTYSYGGNAVTGRQTVYIDPDANGRDYVVWTFDTWNWPNGGDKKYFKPEILWGNQPPYELSSDGMSLYSQYDDLPMSATFKTSTTMVNAGKYTYNSADPWTVKLSAIRDGNTVRLRGEKTIDDVTSVSRIVLKSAKKSLPYYSGDLDGIDAYVAVNIDDAPFELCAYSLVNGIWYNRTAFAEYSGIPSNPIHGGFALALSPASVQVGETVTATLLADPDAPHYSYIVWSCTPDDHPDMATWSYRIQDENGTWYERAANGDEIPISAADALTYRVASAYPGGHHIGVTVYDHHPPCQGLEQRATLAKSFEALYKSGSSPVRIQVVDERTGALIAGSNIQVIDSQLPPFEGTGINPIIDTTLPQGSEMFYLQRNAYDEPRYRIFADADGYRQISENQWFSVNPATPNTVTTVKVQMAAAAAAPPEDPNNAYVTFRIRDEDGNPVREARVTLDRWTRHALGTRPVTFEVPRGTYQYTVEPIDPGLYPATGSVTVGAEDSYEVNVVLSRTPGDDPGATPPPRDTRTNEEKGKAVIDLLADNAELIATLAILAAVMGLINLIMPGRRRR